MKKFDHWKNFQNFWELEEKKVTVVAVNLSV